MVPTMSTGVSPATLVAVTKEAERALAGTREVPVTQFPFRVGRERRSPESDRHLPPEVAQRRRGESPPANDLYLQEESSRNLHISGEHFAIEFVDGRFFLVDRGSACGTIVAGRRVGGHRKGGRTELHDGDEVIVGTGRSRYVFQFRIATSKA